MEKVVRVFLEAAECLWSCHEQAQDAIYRGLEDGTPWSIDAGVAAKFSAALRYAAEDLRDGRSPVVVFYGLLDEAYRADSRASEEIFEIFSQAVAEGLSYIIK